VAAAELVLVVAGDCRVFGDLTITVGFSNVLENYASEKPIFRKGYINITMLRRCGGCRTCACSGW
jgi:hypothetical protein